MSGLKGKLIILFFAFAAFAMAQEKKAFTLNDLLPGGDNYHNCRPQNAWFTWWGEECVRQDVEQLTAISQKTGTETVLVTLSQINSWLSVANLGTLRSLYQVSFPMGDEPVVEVQTSGAKALVNWKTESVIWSIPLIEKAANTDWNSVSRHLAYTIDNNLYITTAEGKKLQVTNESAGIKCGHSVHRDEFGIYKGTFWSPKGNLLAFYRMDESMVSDYPQVDVSTRVATYQPDKYPMAGMTSHKVTIGVFNPQTDKTVFLQAGDPTDRYFTNISWSPDEKKLYIIELNRDQNHAELVRYDVATGEREVVLFEEKHPKYVEPQEPIVFLPWNNDLFIYQSQRDGFNHLYLYNTKGELQKQLTAGEWLVQKLQGFNAKRKEIIITSTEISPLQSNTYAVSVANGKRRLIGGNEGVHNIQLSSSGRYIIDKYGSPGVPRKICISSTEDGKIKQELVESKDPWADYKTPEITIGNLKAADGVTDLYYRLVKPVDFDPNKKYPAVIYVYGGPHAQNIQADWNYAVRGWDIYMAEKGYVILTVDNRGSCNRGLEFENCIFRHLGEEEMKDQMKGVELLKTLPYVDMSRLGVHGWSYGGFMTINLMLTYPDVFKAGVAGGPVIDWKYYEVMYGERYMDTPESNPEGYKNSNLNEKVDNLQGRLLVIHGGNDPVCVPQHTFSFLRSCVDKGKHPDLFIYPGHGHNMLGKDRVHLHEHITRYFEDFLK